MNITRCKGAIPHFFDSDKYSECPVCGERAAENGESAAAYARPEKVDGGKAVKPQKISHENGSKKKWGWKWDKNNETGRETEKTETVAASGTVEIDSWGNNERSGMIPIPPQPQNPPEKSPKEISRNGAPDMFDNKAYSPLLENGQKNNAVFSNISDDDGKTVGIYKNVHTEPVVGWLVCIKGESVGESYILKTGKNSIGRGAGMDVMLAKESTVSRDRHAVITFEPKKRLFLLQPGDGNGMVYLNDDLLLEFRELKSRDAIQLGEALFMFYPFCGEDFTWDDYIEK